MSSLFKYVSEENFAQGLIERGEIFMQTLANFRGYEDNDVRRDRDDGRLRYEPAGGLLVNVEGREDEPPWQGWRFTSSIKPEDVYVYCLSTERSEELARKFESPFCIEITNPITLIARIRGSVRLRSSLERNRLFFGEVEYRSVEAAPAADWALPEKIAFIKPEDWSWQHEYRILVGKKGVFNIENVHLTLETGPGAIAPFADNPPLMLRVGNIARIATLHRF